ncbi:ferritin-like domain-containing protein [Rhodomicrobium lacus]|jgi:ferritin-like metal-binding protein YciE|uniref:YciE/YciF ferroxidase family protein n=1 Tax=Rhodomicrobium TaxID=1068 RepID=UPI000F8DC057|nr:ferritin-like domain-containing protein [Rhodomicrobium lacus]WKW50549.1 ferritin-like domain-containing protein [Rhodomicrobium lacus]
MPMAKNLNELFYATLQDIYHGEKQILKALPKMAKNATTPELKKAFQLHLDQTQGQVERLQQVFEMLDKSARGKTCEAIEGLVEEGQEVMSETEPGEVMDAGLIAAAQAVEHYEIARYGTLCAWAEQLGMPEAAKLLQQTLKEEKETDALLNKMAMGGINRSAA